MPEHLSIPLPDGIRLDADVYGGQDPSVTVILLHGWTLDRRIWRHQIEALAAAGLPVRIVAYDARGHGHSGPVRHSTSTLAHLGDDLAEAVRAAATPRVVLAGHSLGGMAIMEYAARHPGEFARRVAGLVLVSTTAEGTRHTSYGLPPPLARAVRVAEVAGAGLLAGLGALATHPAVPAGCRPSQILLRPLRPGLRWLLFGDLADPADLRLTAATVAGTSLRTIGSFRSSVGAQQRLETLAALPPIPTEVLVGDRDRLTPQACAEAIAAALPGARLTICPGGGHMLTLERAGEVSTALVAVTRTAVATTRTTVGTTRTRQASPAR